jgi:hypothetical protein
VARRLDLLIIGAIVTSLDESFFEGKMAAAEHGFFLLPVTMSCPGDVTDLDKTLSEVMLSSERGVLLLPMSVELLNDVVSSEFDEVGVIMLLSISVVSSAVVGVGIGSCLVFDGPGVGSGIVGSGVGPSPEEKATFLSFDNSIQRLNSSL